MPLGSARSRLRATTVDGPSGSGVPGRVSVVARTGRAAAASAATSRERRIVGTAGSRTARVSTVVARLASAVRSGRASVVTGRASVGAARTA